MSHALIFRDRTEAGHLLAGSLAGYDRARDTVVLALPRGGVPVACALARQLHLPVGIVTVRKLGVPGHEEFAFGAVASGGVQVIQQPVVDSLHLTPEGIDEVVARERQELRRREQRYLPCFPHRELSGKTVILVDDGIATGSTMVAAVYAVRQRSARRIIVAAPTASRDACERIAELVDELVIPSRPDHFHAVSQWYVDFPQLDDDEVCALGRSLSHGVAAPTRATTPEAGDDHNA